MEIFTLVTGVIYVVLEIRQKNFMWIVGMVNALAAMYMFFSKDLYASFGVNTYYFAIAFWGLYQWRRDARRLKAGLEVSGKMEGAVSDKSDAIHLNRMCCGLLPWTGRSAFCDCRTGRSYVRS